MPARPLLTLLLILTTVAAVAKGETRSVAAARATINRSDLKTHVDVLADDTFEGREAGARGGYAAAGYLARQLQRLELPAGGDRGTYFQAFEGNSRNVLARIEGSDPALKQEVIVVSAHYDHVGYGTRRNSYGPWGYIHNGADDNASGVAALLEIAEALSQLPTAPRRSLLLAFWDGEEKGLLGSKYWMRAPTVPLASVKCCVNVDMVGRLTQRRVEVYGTRTAVGLRQLVSEANSPRLDLDFTWQMKDDSDHWPFYSQGIPVLMLHTGLHKDYHRPSDDAELINHAGLEEVSRLLFETVLGLANADRLGAFRNESRRETNEVKRSLETPLTTPSPRLGMSWKAIADEEGHVRLRATSFTRGAAAEAAGLRLGDEVLAVDGAPIGNDVWFRHYVQATSQPLRLTIERESARSEMVVKLIGPPVPLGIVPRFDSAEPGVVLVGQVLPYSLAATAGIAVADRILAVDDNPVATAADFAASVIAAKDQVTLKVERRGQLRDVVVSLGDKPNPN